MKAFILTLFLFQISLGCFSQQKLKFTYDASGNQILRDRVCATCREKNPELMTDSLLASTILDDFETSKNFKITAYPNPVKDLLNVDFQNWENAQPRSMELFSIEGKLVLHQSILGKQNNHTLSLGHYPNGVYLLKISTMKGGSRTFKIIKS